MLAAPAGAYANVITDWDEKAVSIVQGNAPARQSSHARRALSAKSRAISCPKLAPVVVA
jgi:hypothetical protein